MKAGDPIRLHTLTEKPDESWRIVCTNMDDAPYYCVFDDIRFDLYNRDNSRRFATRASWSTRASDFLMESDPRRGQVAALARPERIEAIEALARERLTEFLEETPVLERHTTHNGHPYHFQDDRYAQSLKALFPEARRSPFYANIDHLHRGGYSFRIYPDGGRRDKPWWSCEEFVYPTYDVAIEEAEQVLVVLFEEQHARHHQKVTFPNLFAQLNLKLTNILNAAQYQKHRHPSEVAHAHMALPPTAIVTVPEYAELIAFVVERAGYFPHDTRALVWDWIAEASALVASEHK